MRTDYIKVTCRGSGMESALDQAEKVAAYKDLTPKKALHLRLLTEEMMGLMRSLTGEQEGIFWIEDDGDLFRLHLQMQTRMTSDKRDQLLSVASSGKNEAARGLMGRLRDIFDRGADEDLAAASPLLMGGSYDSSSSPSLEWEWSMTRYEASLSARIAQDNAAREAWDELEKSVVARVASDVKVSIRSGLVEMIAEMQ